MWVICILRKPLPLNKYASGQHKNGVYLCVKLYWLHWRYLQKWLSIPNMQLMYSHYQQTVFPYRWSLLVFWRLWNLIKNLLFTSSPILVCVSTHTPPCLNSWFCIQLNLPMISMHLKGNIMKSGLGGVKHMCIWIMFSQNFRKLRAVTEELPRWSWERN